MFCSKCGANLPDDSAFCTKCGASIESKVSLDKNFPEVSAPVQTHPQVVGMVCRACLKPLTTKWKKCPYCDEPNPFYIAPDPEPEKQTSTPQTQVIIHEREIVNHNDDSNGCATLVGKIVLGLLELGFLIWLLAQCSNG